MLSIINNRLFRSGLTSLTLLKDSFLTMHQVKLFRKFSPYFEVFNAIIGQIISSGLFEFLLKNETNPRGIKKIDEDIGPQVLTLDHLEVGFFVCIVLLIFSLIVFACEIFVQKYKFKLICRNHAFRNDTCSAGM